MMQDIASLETRMLGFEVAILDAVAHATMSVSPPGIERSVACFVSNDVANAGTRQLEAGEARLQEAISNGRTLRAEIADLKEQVGGDALPLIDRAIAVADKRLKERVRFFDHERRLVPRYRKIIELHSPQHLAQYDALEVSWRDIRRREHEEIVDFLCFLRAIRSEIDEQGRAVTATFSDAGSWRKSASRLVN